jgi:hypothetical protein
VTHAVVLYIRRHCGLRDEAAVELRRLADDLGFAFAERDIDSDPALRTRYDAGIPVVAGDGVVIAEAPFAADDLLASCCPRRSQKLRAVCSTGFVSGHGPAAGCASPGRSDLASP